MLVGFLAAVARAQPPDEWLQRIDTADLKRHCATLASDTLEGRAAGTRGGQAAAAYLVTEFKRLGAQPAGDGNDFRQAFGANYANLLARFPGTDAELRDELIVLGAHYDHVGFGNSTNSFGPLGQIHNGADDNASGVAVLLEVAQALQASRVPLRRSVVLAAWDAEESGLQGSQFWVSQSAVRRRQIKLAVNLDMVGRLQQDRVLVMGWRSAAGLRSLLAEQNGTAALAIQFEPMVTDDSDHYSFYAGQVPVLHFDTGKHGDYHRPSDDVDKLQFEGMVRIGQVIARLVQTAANAPTLPAFRVESWREPKAPKFDPLARRAVPVRLGVSWNPEQLKGGRVEVFQTTPQSPAALAGLQPGDQITQFDRWEGGTPEDLRTAITTAPASVRIGWLRPGVNEPMSATVRLLGDPVRCGVAVLPDPAVPGAVTITHVVETSPADRAGLQPGDILLRWAEAEVSTSEDLARQVQKSNGTVRLQIEREGRFLEKTVALPPLP